MVRYFFVGSGIFSFFFIIFVAILVFMRLTDKTENQEWQAGMTAKWLLPGW